MAEDQGSKDVERMREKIDSLVNQVKSMTAELAQVKLERDALLWQRYEDEVDREEDRRFVATWKTCPRCGLADTKVRGGRYFCTNCDQEYNPYPPTR